jgi:hypothetical protein
MGYDSLCAWLMIRGVYGLWYTVCMDYDSQCVWVMIHSVHGLWFTVYMVCDLQCVWVMIHCVWVMIHSVYGLWFVVYGLWFAMCMVFLKRLSLFSCRYTLINVKGYKDRNSRSINQLPMETRYRNNHPTDTYNGLWFIVCMGYDS